MDYDITIKNRDGLLIAEIATQTPARQITDRDTGEVIDVPKGKRDRVAVSLFDHGPEIDVEVAPATEKEPAKINKERKPHKDWTPEEATAAKLAFNTGLREKLENIPGAIAALAEVTVNDNIVGVVAK